MEDRVEHSHICGYCGHWWTHRTKSQLEQFLFVSEAQQRSEHTCEKCGTESWHKSQDSAPDFLRGVLDSQPSEHHNHAGTIYCDNCGERMVSK